MATILSLEPLLHTLPSVIAGKAEHDQEPAGGSTSVPDQHSLAARLQRLWQERGDFSKLSVEQLLLEGESDEEEATATKDGGLDADQPLEASENNEDGKRQEAEEEQSLTQEQLWELKVGMLQGLDLARSDITSALDLLQLLLNPLNALSPPVPEEALALPSGSMSSSSLHTPLPPPAEGIHVRNTALSLATKTQAVEKASDLLRNASKRLNRTTDKSQSEWTDLLRLKRSGQWRIEARSALVPPQAGPSSAPFVPNIPVDKMARDLCIFCGIEESAYRWRQAGLVRLDNAANLPKGKGKERLNVPERLEGRRRMCIKLSVDGFGGSEESSQAHLVNSLDEDDIHSALVQVQQELFEEEIFAELIREARDQPAGITAIRNTIEIREPGSFTLTISMEDVEDIRDKATSQPSSASPHRALPSLLLLLARLQMTQIYRRRRQRTMTVGVDSKSQSVPVNITKALRQLLFYYRHASLVKQVLSGCMKTFQDCGLFEQKLSLDFAGCLDSPASILQALSVEALSLEGVACLTMGSQKLNLSFSGSSAIVIHLPTRNLPIGNMQDFIIILKRILKAAILKELEANLKKILDGTPNSDAWEVLPTPKAVTKTTTFLARKLADKNKKLKEAEVEAYISILPTVTTVSSDPYQIEIALAATVSTRHSNFASRRTFSSAVDSEPNLLDWLKDKIHHI